MSHTDTQYSFEEIAPKVHDSVVDTIPQFDLILTRHTMMHLKLKDGAAMLRNFYNSGTHFLLATNFPEIKVGTFLNIPILQLLYLG